MSLALSVEGFAEKRDQLRQLLTTSPHFAQSVEDLVRDVLREVRKRLSEKSAQAMKSDPRKAYRAVKMAVYRQIIGGNVSILNRRKAGAPGNYQPVRTLRAGQRGGNRRKRSERTNQVDSYMGADRGFILRFLNAGTDDRMTIYGNRKKITPRGWFATNAPAEMEKAAKDIAKLIDDMIEDKLE